MTHPTDEVLIRLLDGDLRENEGAALRAHLPACADCAKRFDELQQLIGTLAQPVSGIDPEAEAVIVLRKIRVAEAAAPAPRFRTWLWGSSGLLAAAAALILFVRARPIESTDQFTARGGARQPEIARKVGVDLDVTLVDHSARIRGVFHNLLPRPAHALVFAVDARDQVHWIYPGYTDEKTDPASVILPANTSQAAFPDGALLDAPAAGRLRIVTLVSPAPLHVSNVERLDAAARTAAALRDRFPSSDVREQSVVLR
jgi:hypothetical protein